MNPDIEKKLNILKKKDKDKTPQDSQFIEALIQNIQNKTEATEVLNTFLNDIRSIVGEIGKATSNKESDLEIFKSYLKDISIKYHNSNLGLARNMDEMLGQLKAFVINQSANSKPEEFDYKKLASIIEINIKKIVEKIVIPINEQPKRIEIYKSGNQLREIIETYETFSLKKSISYERGGKVVIDIEKL